jgi:hypothetical protein
MSFWIRVRGIEELAGFSEDNLVVSRGKIKSLLNY